MAAAFFLIVPTVCAFGADCGLQLRELLRSSYVRSSYVAIRRFYTKFVCRNERFLHRRSKGAALYVAHSERRRRKLWVPRKKRFSHNVAILIHPNAGLDSLGCYRSRKPRKSTNPEFCNCLLILILLFFNPQSRKRQF